ncbi:hypothetical protein EL26_21365 [Tumebacillus flagellatus]|uniref:Spore coat protein GerQ n=2 Tax=Tumebacillus flagellatus TaxID=1157490 RepID=A0A074LL68_9BACL|nr:hypothetical protein EL26_21365 [Tumebacillus flagellatus]
MYHPVAMPIPGMPMAPNMPYPGGYAGTAGIPGGTGFTGAGGSTPAANTGTDIPSPLGGPGEESYIENILRFNHGKIATLYLTYENNTQWNAKIIRGRIETAGRDHIIVSDPSTGKRYLLQMVNLDWVEFDGPINYIAPKLPPNIAGQLTQG